MTIKNNNTDALLVEISKKLDVLARLTSLMLPDRIKQDDKIKILDGVGLQPKEIATILGTTSNVVSVTLNRINKKVKSSKKIIER